MKITVKFTFHLKNGKTFECIEELSAENFLKAVDIVKTAMREGINGMLQFEDCCVRLSECVVVEWEEISE